MEHECPALSDELYNHPILVAARAGDAREARRIVRATDARELGWLLLVAADMRLERLILHLIRRGVDVGARCAQGRTAAHYVCASPRPEKIFGALLDAGADPNAHDLAGNVAIDFANVKTRKVLVKLQEEY
jgi:ankyrin repeat protein